MALEYIQIGIGVKAEKDAFSAGCQAAKQALAQITLYQPSLVLVYASAKYDLQEVLNGITSLTGNTPLVGSSTDGEINSLSFQQESVVVTILASPYLRVNIGIGQGIEKNCSSAVETAFSQARVNEYLSYEHLGGRLKVSYLNPYKSIFALTFLPGKVKDYKAKGMEVVNLLRRKSGNKLPVFGGCSATNNQEQPTYQLANGKVYTDSLVLALVETDLKFGIGKAHGFIPTKQYLLVTKAKGCVIQELDYRPAAKVYAALHRITLEELRQNPRHYFQTHPFGLRDMYGRYYLLDADRVTEDNGIELYMKVQENSLVAIMTSNVERVIESEQKSINKALIHGEIKKPALALLHSCVLRKELLGAKREQCINFLTENLSGIPLAGFYSYGELAVSEEEVPMYFNGTAVSLVLGNELNPVSQIVLNNTRLYEEINTLYKVSTALSSSLQLEEILEKNAALVRAAMKVDKCYVLLAEDMDLGLKPNFIKSEEKWLEEICNLVIQQKEPVIAEQNSLLAVPIVYKEKGIGAVVVVSNEADYFTKREADFLSALANQAGVAIANAHFYKMMEHSAYTDGLTSLYNHRYFQIRLEEELRRAQRNKAKLSLLMLDIDYFKHYNDTNGHPRGDLVLKEIANTLTKSVRVIDVVSRYGGEEFAVILPETDEEIAFIVAERIRKNIEQNNLLDQEGYPVTVSIGIASYPNSAGRKGELIEKADQALYRAKSNGRNQVCIF